MINGKNSMQDQYEKKITWLTRLKNGLLNTGQKLNKLFLVEKVNESLFEELESALIMADTGPIATEKLMTELRLKIKKAKIENPIQVKEILRTLLLNRLCALEKKFNLKNSKPLVIMFVGVNGVGKTTSIGKLAHIFQKKNASVLLAAADTFRIAAYEQLFEWGKRNKIEVFTQNSTKDPASLAFNAVRIAKDCDKKIVMIDTAGRLPTQLHLMEELKKIKRVVSKIDVTAPHEIILVVDGNMGQNTLAHIRAFDTILGLTGLIITKLDGTAKGGILTSVSVSNNSTRPIPVYWIGVGENLDDLQPFVAKEFVNAILMN